jgi:hypothetical protein
LTGGTLLIILLFLVVGVSWFISIQSAKANASRSRADGLRDRTYLRVCYTIKKNELNRRDLEVIAIKYNLRKNERPDFEDILRLNHGCKPAPGAEALVCSEGPCYPLTARIQCGGCVLLVPLRD